MRTRRILAEATVIACGTLFWLVVTAFVGLPNREEPPRAEAAGPAPDFPPPVLFLDPGPPNR